MSTLQRQVIQSLNGLSDDNLSFILDMIQRFMKPDEAEKKTLNRVTTGRNSIRRIVWSNELMKVLIDTHIAIWTVLNDPDVFNT